MVHTRMAIYYGLMVYSKHIDCQGWKIMYKSVHTSVTV